MKASKTLAGVLAHSFSLVKVTGSLQEGRKAGPPKHVRPMPQSPMILVLHTEDTVTSWGKDLGRGQEPAILSFLVLNWSHNLQREYPLILERYFFFLLNEGKLKALVKVMHCSDNTAIGYHTIYSGARTTHPSVSSS